jgi:hypothetical protein
MDVLGGIVVRHARMNEQRSRLLDEVDLKLVKWLLSYSTAIERDDFVRLDQLKRCQIDLFQVFCIFCYDRNKGN